MLYTNAQQQFVVGTYMLQIDTRGHFYPVLFTYHIHIIFIFTRLIFVSRYFGVFPFWFSYFGTWHTATLGIVAQQLFVRTMHARHFILVSLPRISFRWLVTAPVSSLQSSSECSVLVISTSMAYQVPGRTLQLPEAPVSTNSLSAVFYCKSPKVAHDS